MVRTLGLQEQSGGSVFNVNLKLLLFLKHILELSIISK